MPSPGEIIAGLQSGSQKGMEVGAGSGPSWAAHFHMAEPSAAGGTTMVSMSLSGSMPTGGEQ